MSPSEGPVRADDNYVFTPDASFYAELAIAFARLLTHGNGGSFRLTLAQRQELGGVKIARTRDEQTGDLIFTITEADQ